MYGLRSDDDDGGGGGDGDGDDDDTTTTTTIMIMKSNVPNYYVTGENQIQVDFF